MKRVSVSDISELCEELSIVDCTGIESCDYLIYDKVLDEIREDAEGFLQKYTEALLHNIQIGVSTLTGKRVEYRGFGKRHGNIITMLVKTEVKCE